MRKARIERNTKETKINIELDKVIKPEDESNGN